ncbi:FAD:protein FMN transferase [Thermodesulfobacteriota bacterium]
MSPFGNDKGLDRREFLRLSGALGIGVAGVGLLPISESVAFDRTLFKVSRTAEAMGTFVSITAMHPSRSKADDAIGRALEEMSRVSRLLDRHDAASPVGVLNALGRAEQVPPELMEVLVRSRHFHRMSGGLFDITVQPVVDFCRSYFDVHSKPPPSDQLTSLLSLVDGECVSLGGRHARLTREGMGITLDGIAKGYVIDSGARALRENGIAHGLINAGGDICAVGEKEDGKAWKVAVRNPQSSGPYLDVVRLKNGAVATSGNYEVFFDEEKLYHHIVNPETGRSPLESSSVTVMASATTDADALSTAVFVMGPVRGGQLIEHITGAECLILSRSGRKSSSSGWRRG